VECLVPEPKSTGDFGHFAGLLIIDMPATDFRKAMISARSLATILLLAAALATAQASNKPDGSWKALVHRAGQQCVVNLLLGADRQYSETIECGNRLTHQSGDYTFSKSVLVLNVVDWDPSQASLTNRYPGRQQPAGKPSGGSYRVSLPTFNTMILRNLDSGEKITFRRLK
jgi:hypothetical protein